MKIIAIVECDNCCTLKEIEIREGEQVIKGCGCGYFGEDDAKITLKVEILSN